jgi:hypothetical protein
MEAMVMCTLSHSPSGLPKGWTLGRSLNSDRMSDVWKRRISPADWHMAEHLSAEAGSKGVCPNHVRILRAEIARALAGGW